MSAVKYKHAFLSAAGLVAVALLLSACSADSDTADEAAAARGVATSRAPFMLTLDELAAWRADGHLADADNVSSEPLAARFIDSRSQLFPKLPAKAKVLIAPDGIDALANSLHEREQFNHYTFTHWASIDTVNWFGGTAELNVSIPSRPWVEAAHRNGVKVLGTVFFAPRAWGGSIEQPAEFVRRDEDGQFVYLQPLIDIANYYGFDGWLLNQETDLGDDAGGIGRDWLEFMTEMTARRPEGMEIHWYDAMLPSGEVAWQNELNDKNAAFLQNGDARTADAMFVNYWWDRQRIQTSLSTVQAVSRSPYDVYTGADLWPGRNAQYSARAPQWLEMLDDDRQAPLTSIALFANNYNFIFGGSAEQAAESTFRTDASDVAAFYRSANRLFGGDDGNPARLDGAGHWPGVGSRIPARSTLTSLPFVTHFSAGHGKMKARQGVVDEQPWHDMSAQDMLPTWQFAVLGDSQTQVDFDFERAFEKGNSLRVLPSPAGGASSVPLFKTRFDRRTLLVVDVVHSLAGDYSGATLWLESGSGEMHRQPLPPTSGDWRHSSFAIAALNDDEVIRIGIDIAASTDDIAAGALHLGELRIRRGVAD